MFTINPPDYVIKTLEKLKKHGAEGWLVGGCVRDALLGRTPDDFDVAVSVPPEKTMEIFGGDEGYHVIPTGLKHGTVTVHVDGHDLELTTFRRDGEYLDSRHPKEVRFVSDVETDLSRRDFTVNAAAWNPDRGLCDPFGAAGDAARGVIRCVGEPKMRFGEDALRILRALRFASVLDFTIDEATDRAIRAMYRDLGNISAERIRVELLKLICGPGAVGVLLDYKEVAGYVMPELRRCMGYDPGIRHKYDVYEHCVRTMGAIEKEIPAPDAGYIAGTLNRRELAELRLAALFHDVGKPEYCVTSADGRAHFPRHESDGARITGAAMRRLRFDRAATARVCRIIVRHDSYPKANRPAVRRDIYEAGGDLWWQIEALRRADNSAKAELAYEGDSDYFRAVEEIARAVFEDGDCVSPETLAVDGVDLKALGVSGVVLGDVKRRLFDEVLGGRIENDPSVLLARAKEILETENI